MPLSHIHSKKLNHTTYAYIIQSKNLAQTNSSPGFVLKNRLCVGFVSAWNTVCEVSEFVFASLFITKHLCREEQLWSTRAVARICGRLQFDIKRDRGRGAHVVARLEPGCQIGVTRFCCRQGKIAEEGAVFQGVEKMAPAYKILPPPRL